MVLPEGFVRKELSDDDVEEGERVVDDGTDVGMSS